MVIVFSACIVSGTLIGLPIARKIEEIIYELGDQLWYISEIARELEYELQEVAEMNIKKLRDRQERNKLHGDGDSR